MTTDTLRERLSLGEVLLGFGNALPAAGIIEVMAPGWDFVWIDGQHGSFGYSQAAEAQRAAEAMRIATLMRVAGQHPDVIGRYADLAPQALMVPMVNAAEEAAAVVAAVRFPPRGHRSYGGRRVIDLHGTRYHAHSPPLIVLQIETRRALDQAEAIVRTDGVDLLFAGMDDLKLDMGLDIDTPNFEHPQLRDALAHVAAASRTAGKYAGCVAASASGFRDAVALGYQWIVGASDIGFLLPGSRSRILELRQAADAPATATPKSKTSVYG